MRLHILCFLLAACVGSHGSLHARVMRKPIANQVKRASLLRASRSPQSEILKRLKNMQGQGILGLPGKNAAVAQILILSTPTKKSKARTDGLLAGLEVLGFSNLSHVFVGLDAKEFHTEADEMTQKIIPMTAQQRADWLHADFGNGPIHEASDGLLSSDKFPSSGGLACSLGHYHLWGLAAAASKHTTDDAPSWSIILEDDAHITHVHNKFHVQDPRFLNLEGQELRDRLYGILAAAPPEVHIIHLDDRHCRRAGESKHMYMRGVIGKEIGLWAQGSTAYAVTAYGARMLLSQPFRYSADHWLNVPVLNGQMKAFCPSGDPFFHHEYSHKTSIDNPAIAMM